MDFFGIGAGMLGAARGYLQGARRTGRTTRLMESLKTGDRVIFNTTQEARLFERECLRHELIIHCTVCPAQEPHRVHSLPPVHGRTRFDHGWVERFYEQQMQSAMAQIPKWEAHLSSAPAPEFKGRDYDFK